MFLEVAILPLLGRLACKRSQIDIDFLLAVAKRTADNLLIGINIDDIE